MICQSAQVFTDPDAYLQVSEETQVSGKLVSGSTETGQRREDVDVDFPRVCLGGDRVRIAKPRQLGDTAVKLFDLASHGENANTSRACAEHAPCHGRRQTE